jgi:hypothetical protein
MAADRQARIRERAYYIWLASERVEGRSDEYWQQAEREIEAEDANNAGRPPDSIDEEIFKRDLNEVYLLIDFISGRPDKDLAGLTIPDPTTTWPLGSGQQRPNFDAAEAVKRITPIRWPPPRNEPPRSESAALLLLAKNELAKLAAPARGLTIAYTAMFVGLKGRILRRFWRWVRGQQPAGEDQDYSSRAVLAETAFPDLRRNALIFRFIYICLIGFLGVWLIFTALTYWDTGLGNSILQRAEQLQREKIALLQANPELSPCTMLTENTSDLEKKNASCSQLKTIASSQEQVTQTLVKFSQCRGVNRWWFPRCWPASRFVGRNLGPIAAGNKAEATRTDTEAIASVLSVFSAFILPMMFGLLGTMVAALRALHDKVRDAELAPRDRLLTITSLPIGAVAGLAVGLFFAPSAASSTAVGGSATGGSLTAAGLSFLAGYAADAFFSFIDSERSRVFRATNPPPGAAGAPPQASRQPTQQGGQQAQVGGQQQPQAIQNRPQS